MLDKIDKWIDETIKEHQNKAISSKKFSSQFKGYYSEKFLENSYYVVVDKVPKPNFSNLREMGFGMFLDMEAKGITFKNFYFIQKGYENELTLHFHELVHVAQWKNLGSLNFVQQYMSEISHFGYRDAPLEKMAFGLEAKFHEGKEVFDVLEIVGRSEKITLE